MKILGVDLGSYSIKVAELDAGAKTFALSNFFEIPLSPDPSRDRNLQIIEAMRSLAANYDPANTRWVIGIAQHEVSTHFKRFPFRERPKIQKSLAFELEDEIPLDVSESIFDFKIVEYVGSMTDVITIACPTETIAQALSLSKDCGFDPEIVSVEGLALNNNYQPWNATPPEVSPSLRTPDHDEITSVGAPPSTRPARLYLHVGHNRTVLLVYRDSSLIATRSILWGGADIAGEIARAFNVSMFEAMKILISKSFILMNSAGANPDQIRLSRAVSDQVDFLLKDLRLILLEVRTSFDLDFIGMELTGGASQIQNLGAYLTQGLEVPVNANSQALSRTPSRLNLTPAMEAIAPVAVGLALEGLRRPRNPAINLRKDMFARENLSLKRFWENWRVPAQLALAAFAVFFVYSLVRENIATGLLEKADEKLAEAGKTAAELKGASANEANIRKYIRTQKTLQANQHALTELDAYRSAMDILARLSEKLPGKAPPGQGIDITLFELDNEDLIVKGKVQNTSLLPLIEGALREFAQPKSLTTTSADPGGFAFKMKVNRKN